MIIACKGNCRIANVTLPYLIIQLHLFLHHVCCTFSLFLHGFLTRFYTIFLHDFEKVTSFLEISISCHFDWWLKFNFSYMSISYLSLSLVLFTYIILLKLIACLLGRAVVLSHMVRVRALRPHIIRTWVITLHPPCPSLLSCPLP